MTGRIGRLATPLVAALALSCGGGAATSGGQRSPEPGRSGPRTSVPDFTLRDVEGGELRMAELVGRDVVLLNFWATWCEPCRIEMPHLDRIQREHRARGLRVLAISMDGPESVAEVRSRVSRHGYGFTVLLDEESEATRLYNPRRAAPYNVLVDRSGSIVWSHEGYSPGDEVELEEQIRAALDAGGS